jgi:hypothetical protein
MPSANAFYVDDDYVDDGYAQAGISINWLTKVIFVPKTELNLIQLPPNEEWELDANFFRLELKNLEDSEEGMVYLDTHRHNTEVVLGGITYARTIEIINGYTIEFEDGQYSVNIVGANTNIVDVVNLNQVSLRSNNSAGLIQSGINGGSGPSATQIAQEVWDRLSSLHVDPATMGGLLNTIGTRTLNTLNALNGQDLKLDLILAKNDDILIDTNSLINSMQLCLDILNTVLKYNANRTRIDKNSKSLIVYDDDGTTPIRTFNLKDFDGVASITEMAERDPQ